MINVGDKVIIDPLLHEGYDYEWYVDREMERLAGSVVTITRIREKGVYEIDADEGVWGWTEDMLIPDTIDDYDVEYELEEIDFLFD